MAEDFLSQDPGVSQMPQHGVLSSRATDNLLNHPSLTCSVTLMEDPPLQPPSRLLGYGNTEGPSRPLLWSSWGFPSRVSGPTLILSLIDKATL